MSNTLKLGEAGVLRVTSELLLRDHSPYKPFVDNHGVDIMLHTGLRIQVKTTRLWKETKKYERAGTRSAITRWLYRFTLLPLGYRRSKRVPQHGNSWAKDYSGGYDFLILFGLDEQRFWIVPEYLARGRKMISLGPKRQLKNQAYGKWAAALSLCEGRWDLLTGDSTNQLEKLLGVTEAEVVESHNRYKGRKSSTTDLEVRS